MMIGYRRWLLRRWQRRAVFCLLSASLAVSWAAQPPKTSPTLATPTSSQTAFAGMEVGAFFHFTVNTFCNDEHGDGGRPAAIFNPRQLDVDQWVLAAKSMGAKYAVLTARHEDGFCLWPTRTTEYSVRHCPWKDGQGDVVREFVDACRKHGIAPGLYFSPNYNANALFTAGDRPVIWGKAWDAQTEARYADPAFVEKFKRLEVAQVTELLTEYGPLTRLWMDHWMGSGAANKEIFLAVTEAARRLQPDCVLQGPDTWVPGNETGHVVYPRWNAVNTLDGTINSRPSALKTDHALANDYGLLENDVFSGDPFGKFWRPCECPTYMGFYQGGGWFWHDASQPKPRPLADAVDLYYRTVGLGANLIINLPPDNRGLVPDNLVNAAETFGTEIRRRFDHPIAGAENPSGGDLVEVAWEKPMPIDTVVLMEDTAGGQKIAGYTLEAWVNSQWTALAPANAFPAAKPPYNSHPGFETVGHKKIDRVEPVTTNRVRFRCLKAVASPVKLRSLAVFRSAVSN